MTTSEWYPSSLWNNSSTAMTDENPCLWTNAADFPFEEITCLYPALRPFYFSWELKFDPVPVRDWMVQYPGVPIVACCLYCAAIIFGRAYFASRPAWNARKTLAVWNLLLSAFSALGFVRTLPVVVHMFAHYPWADNFCMDPESHFGSGTTGLWVQCFVLSKFPELFDTFFIVVHKKPLIHLHWYHHVSVLLYCWHSYVTKAPVGIFFCVMNYAVHALMYFYYFLMAVHWKPSWMNAYWITVAQISQMVVGVAVTVIGWYLMIQTSNTHCKLTPNNNLAALIMYGSYLALFVQFFVQRYFGSPKAKKRATTKAHGEIQYDSHQGIADANTTITNGKAKSRPKKE